MTFLFFRLLAGRLVSAVPLMAIVSVMIFVILRMLPSDPIAMLLPPNATVEDAARLRAAYGLDEPLYEQYAIWIGGVLRGDFGVSIHLHQPVGDLLRNTLPATIELVVASAVIGITLGLGGGLLLFALRGTLGEHIGDFVSIAILSLPEFLWSILLLLVFGVALAILPFMGRLDPGIMVPSVTGFLIIDSIFAGPDALASALSHMALPALSLGIAFSPLVMRVVRTALLEIQREDYVDMARARGLGPLRVLLNHQLRNAAIPTVSLIGVQVAFLFGGTMLVEVIYSYPGLGNLMVEAVKAQDLPLIQAVALSYCAVVLILNAAVDASYLVLNPRLRTVLQ